MWLTWGVTAILARVGLAFVLIVVGGVLASLLAAEVLPVVSSLDVPARPMSALGNGFWGQ
jgi:hypothetical protein